MWDRDCLLTLLQRDRAQGRSIEVGLAFVVTIFIRFSLIIVSVCNPSISLAPRPLLVGYALRTKRCQAKSRHDSSRAPLIHTCVLAEARKCLSRSSLGAKKLSRTASLMSQKVWKPACSARVSKLHFLHAAMPNPGISSVKMALGLKGPCLEAVPCRKLRNTSLLLHDASDTKGPTFSKHFTVNSLRATASIPPFQVRIRGCIFIHLFDRGCISVSEGYWRHEATNLLGLSSPPS